MRTAVFPGSFDPVTTGHLDLICRASEMFEHLIVAVLVNSSKNPLCSLEERVDMLEKLTVDLDSVEVASFDGLLADYVEKADAQAIVRGLRSSGDFEYELPLAQANYKLNTHADTIFLAASPEYSYISSSGVKEIMHYGGDIRGMVPELVYEQLQRKKGKLL